MHYIVKMVLRTGGLLHHMTISSKGIEAMYCKTHHQTYKAGSECESCKMYREGARANYTAVNQEAARLAAKAGFPTFKKGSTAQRKWAETIRVEKAEKSDTIRSAIMADELDYLRSAEYWINHRGCNVSEIERRL